MKTKLLSVILTFALMFGMSFGVLSVTADDTAPPTVSAQTAVLLCANNCQVLFDKDSNKQMKPASTTKIMTALLALEQSASNNIDIKFTHDMIAEGSSMGLKVGDIVDLRSLALGMMLVSGNDSANTIAIGTCGSIEDFAKRMNIRAKQIGMENTNFTNPSGLDDAEHYTTAYDMALLMAYAMENSDFADVTSKKTATINFIHPYDKKVTYTNHNKLLSLYEYTVGGKTGFTKASGRTLVSVATKDGVTLVAVTMNDGDDWNDHIKLFEYGFSKLENYVVDDTTQQFTISVDGAGDDITSVGLSAKFRADVVVNKGDASRIKREVIIPDCIDAPVNTYASYGIIKYTLDGEQIACVPLFADKNIPKHKTTIFEKIYKFLNSRIA